jgi:thermitase
VAFLVVVRHGKERQVGIGHHASQRLGAYDNTSASSTIARRSRIAQAALCMLLGSTSVAAIAAQPGVVSPTEDWAKGHILVMPRAGLPDSELGKIIAVHGGKARPIGGSGIYIVDLPAGASEKAVVDQLAHHPQLKFAELDKKMQLALTPNDPYMGSEWHLTKLGVPAALDHATGAGVTIAILDTGVDGTHPDLAAQMVAGWNFYDNNSNTSDVQGHGTATAGTAAATTNNAAGVASMSGQSKIMPIRVTDVNGGALASTVAQGITYAADHGARIASISIDGVAGNSTTISAANYMKSKGGLVVVAAGNAGTNITYSPTTSMIPVSATDSNDLITSWSNYGNFIAVSAPGLNIWTTQKGGGYWACWGTSFSTPVTAGTLALMMSAKPTLSNAQIESLLYSTAVDLGAPGRDPYYGYGRVNTGAAVAAAAGTTTVTDTQAPAASISAPLANASVSGLVAVNVSASDNVGVTKVELRVNGATVATDTSSPYAFTWDSTKVANGMATLTAVAYDAAGNVGTSSSVAVNVANSTTVVADTTPPVVTIVNPKAGSVKGKGTLSISTSASDNSGSAGITQSLYIDGALVATMTGSSLSYTWSMNRVASGSHTITAVATDAAKNSSSTSVIVSK